VEVFLLYHFITLRLVMSLKKSQYILNKNQADILNIFSSQANFMSNFIGCIRDFDSGEPIRWLNCYSILFEQYRHSLASTGGRQLGRRSGRMRIQLPWTGIEFTIDEIIAQTIRSQNVKIEQI
jgi:hypothetical protein